MKRDINILNIVILLAAGLLCASCHKEVKPEVPDEDVHLSRTAISIGDTVMLTIKDAARFASTDMLAQNQIQPLQQWMDTVDGVVMQRTVLICFDEGDHALRLSENDSMILSVTDVAGVDTTSLDIRDITPTLSEPFTFWEIFRWILLLMVIGAVAAAVFFVIRRAKDKKPIIALPKAPQKPADQRAIEALETLRNKQLWQQGKAKEYHTELTDILRGFIEECYHINSTEMTTDQTLDAFEGCPAYSKEAEMLLRQILQTADMVKFAKSEPLPHEHDRSMADAKSFVAACKAKSTTADDENSKSEKQQ